VLKFSDCQLPIWNPVIDALPPSGAATVPLKRLALIDCAVSMDTVRKICSRCKDLERLELPLPIKEMVHLFIYTLDTDHNMTYFSEPLLQ